MELGQSGRGSLLAGSIDIAAVLRAAPMTGYSGRVGLEALTRRLLAPATTNSLAIWRNTYSSPHGIAAEAIEFIAAARASAAEETSGDQSDQGATNE